MKPQKYKIDTFSVLELKMWNECCDKWEKHIDSANIEEVIEEYIFKGGHVASGLLANDIRKMLKGEK